MLVVNEIKYNGVYHFGFNGQEKDDEITGQVGSHLDFGERIYDSRNGRFFSVELITVKYLMLTPINLQAILSVLFN